MAGRTPTIARRTDREAATRSFRPSAADEAKLGKFSYRSGSTDVIGWVLEEATGQPLAELISQHVWKPMGAEFDAFITVDASGFALADHGMNSTLAGPRSRRTAGAEQGRGVRRAGRAVLSLSRTSAHQPATRTGRIHRRKVSSPTTAHSGGARAMNNAISSVPAFMVRRFSLRLTKASSSPCIQHGLAPTATTPQRSGKRTISL